MKDKILRFEITDRCNMKCKMCWSKEWKHQDLERKKNEKLIYDFKKSGGKTIVLTSREPLLSSNFKFVVEKCKKEDLDLKILTNATLITDEIAKYMVESNVISFIAISIHGKNEEHDKITGVNGSLKKAIEGIERLNKYRKQKETNFPEIRLTTVISKQIMNSIDFIIDLAKKYNTQLRIQHLMWHPNRIKESHKKLIKEQFGIEDEIIDGFESECNVDGSDIVKLVDYVDKKCKIENIDFQIYPKMTKEEIKKWYDSKCDSVFNNGYCEHVDDSIRVRANGEVSLCQYIDILFGNITDKDLNDIINDKKFIEIGNDLKKGKLFPICNRCCHVESKKVENDEINNLKI